MSTTNSSLPMIAKIVSIMKLKSFSLGRTKMQKLVFLLNELTPTKTDHVFRFYNYGPFSNELAGDVDYFSKIDIFDTIFYTEKGFYEIVPGSEINTAFQATPLSEAASLDIENLITRFGSKSAAELELVSTLLFVNKYEEEGNKSAPLKERTKALKPKFSPQEVELSFQDIRGSLTLVD